MENYPTNAVVISTQKRHSPVKHYVFIVEVTWSDNSKIPIYRHYSDFTQLHSELTDIIDSSPGYKKLYKLPHFPAKKVFQRNEGSRNANRRGHSFDDYCQALLKMDKTISQHKEVISFFKAKDSDINPPTVNQSKSARNRTSLLKTLSELVPGNKKSHTKQSRKSLELEFTENDPVYVSSPIVCESYRALADYTPQGKGELKLKEEQVVEVVEKYANGWWFVQTEYGFGWTPATYLMKVNDPKPEDESDLEELYSGEKFITTKAYKAELSEEVSFDEGVLVTVIQKFMDGWWIISYQGEVGYAPATYLVSFLNPHFRDSRYGQQQNRRPTHRRRAIKNSSGKYLKESKGRDLSFYKSMHDKMVKLKDQRAAETPQDTHTVDKKSQEYVTLDEILMDRHPVNEKNIICSSISLEGPPLPPRSPSISCLEQSCLVHIDTVPDTNLQRRHSYGGMTRKMDLPSPTKRLSNTDSPDIRKKLYNLAPHISQMRQTQSTEKMAMKQLDVNPKFLVPDICITGSESSGIESCPLTSSEEETPLNWNYDGNRNVKSDTDSNPLVGKEMLDANANEVPEIPDDDTLWDKQESVEENSCRNNTNGVSTTGVNMMNAENSMEYTDGQNPCASNNIQCDTDMAYMSMSKCETAERNTSRENECTKKRGDGRKSPAGHIDSNIVIESLRGKSIRGVYINDKGEMCIQFDEQ